MLSNPLTMGNVQALLDMAPTGNATEAANYKRAVQSFPLQGIRRNLQGLPLRSLRDPQTQNGLGGFWGIILAGASSILGGIAGRRGQPTPSMPYPTGQPPPPLPSLPGYGPGGARVAGFDIQKYIPIAIGAGALILVIMLVKK